MSQILWVEIVSSRIRFNFHIHAKLSFCGNGYWPWPRKFSLIFSFYHRRRNIFSWAASSTDIFIFICTTAKSPNFCATWTTVWGLFLAVNCCLFFFDLHKAWTSTTSISLTRHISRRICFFFFRCDLVEFYIWCSLHLLYFFFRLF